MLDSFPLMVPGATSDRQATVWAPYDGAEIATVAVSDMATVETALATAARLFKDQDGWLSAQKRIEVLEKTAIIMAERFEMLALEAARGRQAVAGQPGRSRPRHRRGQALHRRPAHPARHRDPDGAERVVHEPAGDDHP